MVAARCGSVARAAGAGQEPKEAAWFGDSAPRGRHAHACENVCVSRFSYVCSDQSGLAVVVLRGVEGDGGC